MGLSEHLPKQAANWQSAVMAHLPRTRTILQIYNLCTFRNLGHALSFALSFLHGEIILIISRPSETSKTQERHGRCFKNIFK